WSSRTRRGTLGSAARTACRSDETLTWSLACSTRESSSTAMSGP
ncbi:MAG: hypothetical protein AVDCRST_MAG93-3061, partial [uncultured Chloroflexia bacterium]